MFRFLKRLISVALVLAGIALILNLKIGGTPAREHAFAIWNNDSVQKAYQVVRDRVLALIRKDISVEEVFKPEMSKPAPAPNASPSLKSAAAPSAPAAEPGQVTPPTQSRTIDLEQLDEADRQALEKILEKSSK